MDFSFATATTIIFGNNSVLKVPELAVKSGKNILIVSGKNDALARKLASGFSKALKVSFFKIGSEPTTQLIEEGVKTARQTQTDLVIGIGGGSVLDGAKAIAALVPNPGHLLDYLEIIGLGKPLTENPLPCIAIPTTAGTGSEVTKNSVIKSPEHMVKVSLRHELMFPKYTIIDPVLTHSMPPKLTANTGVDALTHLLETFVSNGANPFVDMLCREGLSRISTSLVKAFKNGNNAEAREDMALASMLGGMALANGKLGAIHGFAGPMGGMYPIPHGAVCACLMPAVTQVNIENLQEQKMDVAKFDKLAQILTQNNKASANDLVFWMKELVSELKIPSLASFGLSEKDFPELAKKAKNASSMKGNPVKLNDEQLIGILQKSL